jgi:ubiquinone/menaquinone biosynthesis C-methylase UbiE
MNDNTLDKDALQVANPPFWNPYHYVCVQLRKTYERVFTSFLKLGSGYRLLDYGCGAKPYEYILKDYCAEYIGVDIGANPKANFNIEPGDNLPVNDNLFDVVLSSQVLEHVEDVPQYLGECKRILKNKGILFISTHGTWQYHSAPIDVQRWTSYGLKKLIEGYGFKIIGFYPVLGQLALTSQLRLTFFNSTTNMIGVFGKILLIPISIIYQFKMMFEDWITPSRVKERDSSIYLVVAEKI